MEAIAFIVSSLLRIRGKLRGPSGRGSPLYYSLGAGRPGAGGGARMPLNDWMPDETRRMSSSSSRSIAVAMGALVARRA